MKHVYGYFLIVLGSGCLSCTSLIESRPTKQLVITYDYATKSLLDVPEQGYRIKYGGTPKIVVDNVNASQFQIEVDEEQLSITYDSPVDNQENGGRGPAGIGDIIPAVSSDQKLKSTSELIGRSKGLLARLHKYNNTHVEYLDKSYQALVNSTTLSYDEVLASKEELDNVYLPLKQELITQYNAVTPEYLYLVSQLMELQNNEEAEKLSSSLEKAYEEFKELGLTSKLLEIDRKRSFLSKNNFTATYHAPAVMADEVVYLLSIKARGTTSELYRQTDVPISVRVAGNWKIDVSSGVMFNIGLADESFRLDPVKEDSLILVQNTQRSDFSPTVGIMTHVYRKSTGYTNWGISFGLSINDEQRLRYYGGLGVMVGEKQRFVISGGLTAAPRTVLKGSYQVGQKFVSTAAPEELTVDAYRLGGFDSLTYNLTSNTTKAVKGAAPRE